MRVDVDEAWRDNQALNRNLLSRRAGHGTNGNNPAVSHPQIRRARRRPRSVHHDTATQHKIQHNTILILQ